MVGEPFHDTLQPVSIVLVEGIQVQRIDVEHRDQTPTSIHHGHYDFRTRAGITCDVSGKCVDVIDDHCVHFRSYPPADTLAESDLETSERSLVRSDSKQEIRSYYAVEASPEESESVMNEGAHRGHRG